jgi:hypothetical protein
MNQAALQKSPAVQLEAPRMENSKALPIAGLRSTTLRFAPHIGNVPGQVGMVALLPT